MMLNVKNQGADGQRDDCKRIIKYLVERLEESTVKKKKELNELGKRKWNGNLPKFSCK